MSYTMQEKRLLNLLCNWRGKTPRYMDPFVTFEMLISNNYIKHKKPFFHSLCRIREAGQKPMCEIFVIERL